MRALPLLEARREALEKCVFCPKLCRSACPVSNAEPRETITPWGKMTASWMAAHGDTPVSASHAAPAWACTGCGACQRACDHGNPVSEVLLDARSAFAAAGALPEGARRVLSAFARHDLATRAAATALAAETSAAAGSATTALLVGCGYLRGAPREARDAVDAARALCGKQVQLVGACCGLPLRLAGDAQRFAEHARGVARELASFARLVVVDAGCGLALRRHYPGAGVTLRPEVALLVEIAARSLPALAAVSPPSGEPVRWHDPCQLGRGLGLYDEPRAVLARAIGRAPDELRDSREEAPCSGAGGLLPCTMPEVARAVGDARLGEHRAAGGGRVVTGCASSLVALRKRARGSGVAVDDLVSYIARSLRAAEPRQTP
jgi:Fe-S oxidoreductase